MNKLIKRIISSAAVTAAAALGGLGLLPAGNVVDTPLAVTAFAENTVREVSSWGDLSAALQNDGSVKLTADVTAEDGHNALLVPAYKYVTLDLNGYTLDRGLKEKNAVEDGNVITVNGNLTLTDSSTDKTGTLTGGNTTKDGSGGGVWVSEYGTFTMQGGTISDCYAGNGAGVYVYTNATFTMSGGTISGCGASESGGGVYVNGTFTMSGGTISGCSAYENGGGVWIGESGTFTMSGGKISGCIGRGVFVGSGATFTMSGSARIDGCTNASGGGVYVNGGTFTMEGSARITGCTATNGADNAQGGGGVYVFGGTFNVSGSPVISGNKKGDKTNNVVLNSSKTINVTGALTTDAEIYVTAGKGDTVAVGSNDYPLKASDAECFHSDIDTALASVLVTKDNTEKVKFLGAWEALQSKLDNASTSKTSPTTIKLSGKVMAEEVDTTLEVKSGTYVTLDLNGYTIDRGLKGKDAVGDGNVIKVNGNLTLTDSSTGKDGTITGGKNDGGGGVWVSGSGTFTMNGGTISDCLAGYGGVYVDNGGTFTMSGGTISGCSASFGGGVCVDGTFTMNGGTISGCDAGAGGGVYVGNYSKFTMSGGTISDCSTDNSGGGVYVVDNATFNVSGAPVISGNKKVDDTNNVEFDSDHTTKTINVTDALTTGASIYVNAGKGDAVAVGGGKYTLKASDAEYFHSDSDGLASTLDNGKIVFKAALPALDDIASVTYNGNTQSPVLTFGSETLTKGTDYTVSYKIGETAVTETINAGEYTVIVTGIGGYAGTYRKTFTIAPVAVTTPDITLAPASYVYSGEECTPDVTVKIGDTVIPASEYTVSYSDNINAGDDKAVVTITDNDGGNYTVSGSKTFDIAKADIAPNAPAAAIRTSHNAEKVSDVSLPTDWEWDDTDKNTALVFDTPVNVTANYVGEDKDNYKTVSATVAVTRPSHEHTMTYHPASSGTCSSRSHSEYWVCTGKTDDPGCGEWFSDAEGENVIEDHNSIYGGYGSHSYSYTVTKEATCEEDGSKDGQCRYCGGKRTVTIPKLGHEFDPETGICSRCGKYDPSKFFKVRFDTDGGSEVPAQSVKPNEKAIKPEDPMKEGHEFAGWFLGEEKYSFSDEVTANITLKAYWKANIYTVKFDSKGGTAVPAQKVEYGKTAVKPDDPTRGEITFAGWTLNGEPYDFGTPVTRDITLSAEWNVLKFTVTFDSNGGSTVAEQKVEKDAKAVEPAAPAREGYTFRGWFNGEKKFVFTTPITVDITLTAQWEINKYTVTFDAQGGKPAAAQTVEHGQTVTEPATEKTGYSFVGWLLNGEAYDFSRPVTANITLTAAWKATEYTVTFVLDGNIHSTVNVEYGKKITFPELTPGEGKIILAWYNDAALSDKFSAGTPVTASITLYAAEKDKAPVMENGEPVAGGVDEAISGAAGKHTTITLSDDEDAGNLKFPKKTTAEEITIDGGGSTLEFSGAASIKPNQELTLTDITINAEKDNRPKNITITAAAGGLTLDGVTLIGKKAAISASKGDLTLGDVEVEAESLTIKGAAKTTLTVNGEVEANTVSGFGTVALNGTLTITKSISIDELDLADGAVLNVAAGTTVTIKKGISGSGTLHIADGFKSISISGSITGMTSLTSDKPLTDGTLLFKSKLTDLNEHFDVSGIAPEVTDGEYSYGLYTKSGKVYLRAFKMEVAGQTYCELSDIMNDINKSKEKDKSYELELLGDIDFGKSFKLPSKGKYAGLTIDGNGHTLTCSESSITLTGNLTLTYLTFNATAKNGCTIKQGNFMLDAGGAELVNCTVQ